MGEDSPRRGRSAGKVPGQRTKRKAWGYTAVINGKRRKSYKSEWSKEQAEEALAKALLQIKAPKAEGSSITFAEAKSRHLAAKTRKKSIDGDRRYLTMFESALGAETPLAEITGARISGWNAAGADATAVSVFPHELYQPPGSWAEKAYHNLIYFNEVNTGRALCGLGNQVRKKGWT